MSVSIANAFNFLIMIHSRAVTIERPGESQLVSGITPATSLTLTSDISEGVAYIQGVRIVIPTTSVTYAASSDTYIDISFSGIITYVAVANGAPVPAITANNLRTAKVVTNGTAITAVTMLKTPKEIYGINATAIRVAPANYFRNLSGPGETIIEGKEFVISKNSLDIVSFPPPRRGDRIKDSESGINTISEVREMHGFGGSIIGYRVRTN